MIPSPQIMITGANGQLGKEFQELAPEFPQYHFTFLSRDDLSIEDSKSVEHFFQKLTPDYCINCAAYTNVDQAEDEQELAHLVNAAAPGILAKSCREHGTKLIHVSTDYVFDGNTNEPYDENASPNPQSIYGSSKLEGEKNVIETNPDSIIIRTSWVYSAYGRNFVRTMLRLMREREEIGVVNDQSGAPTWAADIARTIIHIISTDTWHPGIYHYSNGGSITWYEFANAVKEVSGSTCIVKPISTESYPTKARRPRYSVLDNSKIQKTYGIQQKPWRESLLQCIKNIGVVL